MKIKLYWILLIVVVTVVSLVRCKTTVTDKQLNEMDVIAQNINETPDYKIPDGYTVYRPYYSGTIRFYLIKDHTYVIYDKTLEGINRVDVKVYYSTRIILIIGILSIIFVIISYLYSAVKSRTKN